MRMDCDFLNFPLHFLKFLYNSLASNFYFFLFFSDFPDTDEIEDTHFLYSKRVVNFFILWLKNQLK